MKRKYTVSLDEDKVRIAKPYLEKSGMSLSGYLNCALVEFVEAVERVDYMGDVERMPLGEFIALFGRMVRGDKKKLMSP